MGDSKNGGMPLHANTASIGSSAAASDNLTLSPSFDDFSLTGPGLSVAYGAATTASRPSPEAPAISGFDFKDHTDLTSTVKFGAEVKEIPLQAHKDIMKE